MFQNGKKKVISYVRLFAIRLKTPKLVRLNRSKRKLMTEFSVQVAGVNLMRNLPKSIFQVVFREIKVRPNDLLF
jgi:hypothetical protein